MKATNDQLISDQLYMLGEYKILRRCILKNEREDIKRDAHEGTTRGHYVGKPTMHKIMHVGLWWPTIFKATKDYCKAYDTCQKVGNPSKRDEMALNPQVMLQPLHDRFHQTY